VEAVRCAIDIQESLRTRNMAYPPSRQMSFRIGITIGDVVERDGDLLGDGVNIAARLEGLAEVGGICISRAVHEQVANKLSVQFADLGAQEVKNIPTPVHAYMVAMRREDGTYATPQLRKSAAKPAASTPTWMWPLVVAVVCVAAIGVGGFLYLTKLELANKEAVQASQMAAATPPLPAKRASQPTMPPAAAPAVSPNAPSSSPRASGDQLAANVVPFVSDRTRLNFANDYVPASDHKALALNINGFNAIAVGQPSDDVARTTALEQCQKRADAAQSPRKCEIYAVGNTVVYPNASPPMPPMPWIRHDVSIERTFSAKDMPLIRDPGRERLDKSYLSARKSKSVAIGPSGTFIFSVGAETMEEANRRSLESCGALAGVPCMVVAADDVFVVTVPVTMKVTGFFRAASDATIAADARNDLVRKLADASSGWNAVAVGASGRPGLGLKAASEQNAIDDALADCAGRDSNCHVIAIGPFSVGSN
jgi:adenylate cyclase